MMEAILPRSWKEEFEWAASARREELAHRDRMVKFEFVERQRKEQEQNIAEEKQDRQEMADIEIVIATQQQIAAFKVELDNYDTKTVEALMANDEALAAVREKIDAMLDQAEVLPDGRRVFKTKDGQRVFDEHGQELSKTVINPNSIDERKPSWEAFQTETGHEKRLRDERQELSDYQAKLDEARERANSGKMTKDELKAAEAALKDEMPDAVREKMGFAKREQNAEHEKQASAPAMPNDMDALMRRTGFAPGSSGS